MFRRSYVLFTLVAGGILPVAPAAVAADKDKKADKPTVAVFRLRRGRDRGTEGRRFRLRRRPIASRSRTSSSG